MSNKAVVHLRVYKSNGRDAQISYNADRSIQNENILVKLTHDTLEWSNYLKHLLVNGFVKVEVEKVLGVTNLEAIKEEVSKAMHPKKEVVLSPEQKKIADLEAKLDSFMNVGEIDVKAETVKPIEKKESFTDRGGNFQSDDIAEVREEYKKVFGKKAFPGWDIIKLKDKIKNK